MAGGTLAASRSDNLHSFFKERLERFGFSGVHVTSVDKDGLNSLINELKPRFFLIESDFYSCMTIMIKELHKLFPKLNIAVVSLSRYPADKAMYCVINGARSYVNLLDGLAEFNKGMGEVLKGNGYISPEVQRRIDMRSFYPEPSGDLTDYHVEIIRLVCCGFTGKEIADELHRSERTIDNRKTEIYTALTLRNENELIRDALYLGIVKQDELYFFPRSYALKPLPKDDKRRLRKTK
uniref:HTH luxR-type domain-containing protein n=1 Tax=uncultured bacterium contig00004 TaxID=1181496 RepID=A0A806KAD7_9BACT|nr:hypothetical protein [uncultured bacterium contig00004]